MRDSLIGQRLERYEVVELLGEGGMGAVYCARDTVLDRDVALKVMHPQYARKPEFQQRFLNEARVAAQLDHPGIVKVHDYRQDGDYLYIVMEYIAGGNLSQMLQNLRAKQQWLSIREAVQLVRQVGLALDYAHRKGVLHRDIKPANIMIKPEPAGELPYQPVITDLGLARLGEGLGLTQTGISMGTPSYMSPEQAAGKPTDVRSDVYSLGILLYELAVGQLPFKANTISEAITFHTTQPPPPPRSLRPDISQPLEQAILRALQKDPSARYASAAALVQALDALPPATPGPTLPAEQGTGGAAPQRAGSAPTRVEPGAPALRGLSVLEQFAPAPSGPAQLQLLSPDGKVKSLALEPGVLTVGRSLDNTLPVNDPKVSQQHLRLEYDGSRCRVTDQNSTNGTYMGTVRLLAGVAQLWDAQTPLRIGDHYLRLATATSKTSVGTATDGKTVLGTLQGQDRAEPPAVLQVEAGGQVSTSVMLHNQTNLVDALALQVEGIPSTWVKLPPPANLYPQDQQAVTLMFQPPRSSESTAKNYDVRLSVYSRNANAVTPHSTLKLQVMPFRQVQSRLTQQTLRERQAAGVVLENLGNAPQRFQVSWSDPANELQFDPSQAETVVEPGKSVTSSFQVRVKQKRWLGGVKPHPLTVQVSADGGEKPQEFAATLQSRGLIPAWLPIFLLLLLTGLGVLLVQQIGKSQTDAEIAAANMRATETASALTADVDGDGLSAAKEAELDTDPNNADTDGDGLKDGDEVRQGTSPQVVDTDGDTLPDGFEVSNGTSPVKADTDSDGISDNVDPAPKQLPTSTPTPNLSATAEVYAQQTAAAVQATQRAEQAIVATQQAVAAAAAQATAASAQATAMAEAAIAATATAEWLIDNPQIEVGVDRTSITAGECVNLYWQTSNVSAVYLNGTAVDQVGNSTDCPPTTTNYQWQIVKFNGNTETRDVTVAVQPQPEPAADLAGDWRNVDSNTGGMTRLIIENVDDTTVTFHGFGACSPSDCDWGVINADKSSATEAVGRFDFGFVVTQVSVRLEGEQLLADVYDDFAETDGRQDASYSYVMAR